jgi:hypothetical protein
MVDVVRVLICVCHSHPVTNIGVDLLQSSIAAKKTGIAAINALAAARFWINATFLD